jgi:rhamnosyltransferase
MRTYPPNSVGIAIPTYRAAALLPKTLTPIMASPLKPRVLVVDSSSDDGTIEVAQRLGAETFTLPKCEFNHGTTRELARRRLGTEIVVMLTHDAILASPEMLSHLVRPIMEGRAAISYAHQVPHEGADFFEAFPRRFNYPDKSDLRSASDIPRYGAHTFFCSNSCCAWSNSALDAIGGFEKTLSLEDTIAVAKLLRLGNKIAYCADAVVRHSHRYTLKQEFKRYFDIGYVRALNASLLFVAGGDEPRGMAYTKTMLRELIRTRPFAIPHALAVTAVKLAGYKIGYHGNKLPRSLKHDLSSLPDYWAAECE